jgi:hypothetical protein
MILNLTQHPAGPDQVAVGVVNLTGARLTFLRECLTFDSLPTPGGIENAANEIADTAASAMDGRTPDQEEEGVDLFVAPGSQAMIGGAPYLMAPLERALREWGIEPLYAFSVRETEEQTQPDGSVRKTNVFRHAGFVPAVGES